MAELNIVIDPDPGGSPDGATSVRGVVRRADGGEDAFIGWVGLLALLQRAVSDEDPLPTAPA
jgi:hypothetical protein